MLLLPLPKGEGRDHRRKQKQEEASILSTPQRQNKDGQIASPSSKATEETIRRIASSSNTAAAGGDTTQPNSPTKRVKTFLYIEFTKVIINCFIGYFHKFGNNGKLVGIFHLA